MAFSFAAATHPDAIGGLTASAVGGAGICAAGDRLAAFAVRDRRFGAIPCGETTEAPHPASNLAMVFRSKFFFEHSGNQHISAVADKNNAFQDIPRSSLRFDVNIRAEEMC